MDHDQLETGAGPALAAHSKDASTAGQTPASEATGNTGSAASAADGWSGQARQTAERVTSSLAGATRWTRDNVSDQTRYVANQAAETVTTYPLAVLAATGFACLALGYLLGRR